MVSDKDAAAAVKAADLGVLILVLMEYGLGPSKEVSIPPNLQLS